MAFIGCPHLSLKQLNEWTERLVTALSKAGKKKVAVRTILCTAPAVRDAFMKTENYKKLMATGAKLTCICPLMYSNNPLCKKHRIMTASNKLRTYTLARYYTTDQLVEKIVGKK